MNVFYDSDGLLSDSSQTHNRDLGSEDSRGPGQPRQRQSFPDELIAALREACRDENDSGLQRCVHSGYLTSAHLDAAASLVNLHKLVKTIKEPQRTDLNRIADRKTATENEARDRSIVARWNVLNDRVGAAVVAAIEHAFVTNEVPTADDFVVIKAGLELILTIASEGRRGAA